MDHTVISTSFQLIKQRWAEAIAVPDLRRWTSFLMLCDAELSMLDDDAFNAAALRGIRNAAEKELRCLSACFHEPAERNIHDRVADAIRETEQHGYYSLQQWAMLLGESHPAVHELRAMQQELDAAYTELRKMKPSIYAVFDRAVWERARKAGEA